MDERELGAVSALLAEFGTRINDMEEKIRGVYERLAAISQTLLKQGDRTNKEISVLRDEIRTLKNENDRLKEIGEHIMHESAEFARREELKVMERYMKLFEPLKFATLEDVRRIVNKAIKEKEEGIIPVEE
ncbi:MAG: hypothetical protein K6T16_00950 [Candidatus Pacearchaeota archaeon]|nr:hypothetical protein [Candidatus Pacearchaeota archaeon]